VAPSVLYRSEKQSLGAVAVPSGCSIGAVAVRSRRHRSISAPVRAISPQFIGAVAVRLYNHSLCTRLGARSKRSYRRAMNGHGLAIHGRFDYCPRQWLEQRKAIANTLHPWHVLGHDPQCRALRFTQDHTTKLDGTVLNFRVDVVWRCPSLVVDLFQNASPRPLAMGLQPLALPKRSGRFGRHRRKPAAIPYDP
jgi:hypothetical protein